MSDAEAQNRSEVMDLIEKRARLEAKLRPPIKGVPLEARKADIGLSAKVWQVGVEINDVWVGFRATDPTTPGGFVEWIKLLRERAGNDRNLYPVLRAVQDDLWKMILSDIDTEPADDPIEAVTAAVDAVAEREVRDEAVSG